MTESKATSTEVARLAGVSRATVSRVYSGKDPVRPEVAQRVLDAAEQLNYRPNAYARGVRAGRFKNVVLLETAYSNHSVTSRELQLAMHQALDANGYQMSFARVNNKSLTNADYVPTILQTHMADGLLISINKSIPDELIEFIDRQNIPAVWINTKSVSPAVYPDDFEAGQRLTQRFIDQGHTRIVYADNHVRNDEHFSRRERRDGYVAAMEQAGLAVQLMTDEKGSDRELKALLSSPECPTRILCYSGAMANQIVYRCMMPLGLCCPDDIQFGVFGAVHGDVGTPFERLVIPDYDVGHSCVEKLLALIQGDEGARESEPVAYREPGDAVSPFLEG